VLDQREYVTKTEPLSGETVRLDINWLKGHINHL